MISFLFAIIGWIWCGAIMKIGPSFWPMQTTLIIHLIAGPVGFGILSWIYHKKRNAWKPLITAAVWTGLIIFLDAVIVALIILKNFEMFRNPMGTWIPFCLIFTITWLTGFLVQKGNTQ